MLSLCTLRLSRRVLEASVHMRSIRMSFKQVPLLPRPSPPNPWLSVDNLSPPFYLCKLKMLPFLSPHHSFSYCQHCIYHSLSHQYSCKKALSLMVIPDNTRKTKKKKMSSFSVCTFLTSQESLPAASSVFMLSPFAFPAIKPFLCLALPQVIRL